VGYYAIVATAIGAQTLQAGLYVITAQAAEAHGVALKAIALLHTAVYWAAWLLVATTLISIADRLYHTLWHQTQKPLP
jgi:hypothetical protein